MRLAFRIEHFIASFEFWDDGLLVGISGLKLHPSMMEENWKRELVLSLFLENDESFLPDKAEEFRLKNSDQKTEQFVK